MIDPSTYDGRRHAIPFEVGNDFVSKYEAYLNDGFTVAIVGKHLHVVKLSPGDDIPREIVRH